MNKSLVVGLVVTLVAVTSVYGLSVISSGSQVSSNSSTDATSTSTTSSYTTSSQLGITATINSISTTVECPPGQNASSVSNQGLVLLGCFNTSVELGGTVLLQAIVRDDASPIGYGITEASITVRNSTGQVAYQVLCAPSQSFTLQPGKYYECEAEWNTGAAHDGVIPSAGVYTVSIEMAGIPGMTSEADIQIVG